jgi:hypothetical protein
MPVLKVLLNEEGDVIGSAHANSPSQGSYGPQFATMVARPNQRIVEITVDDAVANLDPETLHKTIKANHLR